MTWYRSNVIYKVHCTVSWPKKAWQTKDTVSKSKENLVPKLSG